MDNAFVTTVASHIVDAVQAGAPFEPLAAEHRTENLQDAYRIQQAVYRMLGRDAGLGELGGHKIALTSPAIQELVGLNEPIYGALFGSQIYPSGHVLRLSEYGRLGLEFEVAVVMDKDVPSDDGPMDANRIAPYVRTCLPAFELIDDRAANYDDLEPFSLIADRCWCAGAVVATSSHDFTGVDLSQCASHMRLNGDIVESAHTGLAMGHPFNGLAWVANFLADQGRVLQAGDTVITGSALKTYFVQPGDEVSYEIQGLGEVAVTVAP